MIEARIRGINSQAPIARCQQSVVDPKLLLDLSAFDLDRVLKMDPEFLDTEGEHQHDVSVSSCSCKFPGELHVYKLWEWTRELIATQGTDLFRYKGVFAVKGMAQKYVFHGVHMIFTGDFSETEWREGEERDCRFVFIGRNLDKAALTAGLEACKVQGELRFKVGDEVEALVSGAWRRAHVKMLWDDGIPYCIEVSGTGETGHVTHDDDDNVRAVNK